jgi:hypothetical protein
VASTKNRLIITRRVNKLLTRFGTNWCIIIGRNNQEKGCSMCNYRLFRYLFQPFVSHLMYTDVALAPV